MNGPSTSAVARVNLTENMDLSSTRSVQQSASTQMQSDIIILSDDDEDEDDLLIVYDDTSQSEEHVCNACSKSFTDQSLLIKHLKQHTDPNHCCTCCEKYFEDKNDLISHLKTHVDDNDSEDSDEESLSDDNDSPDLLISNSSLDETEIRIVLPEPRLNSKKNAPVITIDEICQVRTVQNSNSTECDNGGLEEDCFIIENGTDAETTSSCHKSDAQKSVSSKKATASNDPYVCLCCDDRFLNETAFIQHLQNHSFVNQNSFPKRVEKSVSSNESQNKITSPQSLQNRTEKSLRTSSNALQVSKTASPQPLMIQLVDKNQNVCPNGVDESVSFPSNVAHSDVTSLNEFQVALPQSLQPVSSNEYQLDKVTSQQSLQNHSLANQNAVPKRAEESVRSLSNVGHSKSHDISNENESQESRAATQQHLHKKSAAKKNVSPNHVEGFVSDVGHSKSHEPQHETQANKAHLCYICGREFARESSLIGHLNWHERTKTYECDACTLTFLSKSELARHMELHKVNESHNSENSASPREDEEKARRDKAMPTSVNQNHDQNIQNGSCIISIDAETDVAQSHSTKDGHNRKKRHDAIKVSGLENSRCTDSDAIVKLTDTAIDARGSTLVNSNVDQNRTDNAGLFQADVDSLKRLSRNPALAKSNISEMNEHCQNSESDITNLPNIDQNLENTVENDSNVQDLSNVQTGSTEILEVPRLVTDFTVYGKQVRRENNEAPITSNSSAGDSGNVLKSSETTSATRELHMKTSKTNYNHRKVDAAASQAKSNGGIFAPSINHINQAVRLKKHSCSICSIRFSKKEDIKLHMICHSFEKTLKCRICLKQFERTSDVNNHFALHRCGSCYQTNLRSCELFAHKSIHAKSSSVSCSCCHRSFSNTAEFDKHFQAQDCTNCSMWFLRTCDKNEHEKIHLESAIDKICRKCNERFNDPRDLKEHVQMYRCPFCCLYLRGKCALRMHFATHVGISSIMCKICFEWGIREDDNNKHVQSHSESGSNLGCQKCVEWKVQIREKTAHEKTHAKLVNCKLCKKIVTDEHHHVPRLCLICNPNKSFARKCEIDAHMSVHARNTSTICKLCKKVFFDMKALDFHVKTHVETACVRCDMCGSWSSQERDICAHFRVTKCLICNVELSRECEMKAHSEIHTSFDCQLCSESFLQEKEFVTHMFTHGNMQCRICKSSFTRVEDVDEHLKTNHCNEPLQENEINKRKIQPDERSNDRRTVRRTDTNIKMFVRSKAYETRESNDELGNKTVAVLPTPKPLDLASAPQHEPKNVYSEAHENGELSIQTVAAFPTSEPLNLTSLLASAPQRPPRSVCSESHKNVKLSFLTHAALPPADPSDLSSLLASTSQPEPQNMCVTVDSWDLSSLLVSAPQCEPQNACSTHNEDSNVSNGQSVAEAGSPNSPLESEVKCEIDLIEIIDEEDDGQDSANCNSAENHIPSRLSSINGCKEKNSASKPHSPTDFRLSIESVGQVTLQNDQEATNCFDTATKMPNNCVTLDRLVASTNAIVDDIDEIENANAISGPESIVSLPDADDQSINEDSNCIGKALLSDVTPHCRSGKIAEKTKEDRYICAICNEHFTKKCNLRRHINKSHSSLHECYVCNKRFFTENNLHKHVKTHIKQNTYACKICEKQFFLWANMQFHMKLQHADVTCEVESCSEKFPLEAEAMRHSEIREKSLSCKKCHKKSRSKRDMLIHLKTHIRDEPFTCKICKRRFPLKSAITTHMLVHTEKSYSCEKCRKLFHSKAGWFQHLNCRFREPYPCEKCCQSFSTEDLLNVHLRSHSIKSSMTNPSNPENSYSCEKCRKLFHSKAGWVRHVNWRFRFREPYPCEKCCRSFSTEDLLNAHLRSHSIKSSMVNSVKSYSCEKCHKLFCTKRGLNRHVKSLSPYSCRKCCRMFSTEASLSTHLSSHSSKSSISNPLNVSSEESYSCEKCHISFSSKPAIIHHEKMHTRKTFQCELCFRMFSTEASLSTHLSSHSTKPSISNPLNAHSDESYSCEKCHKSFSSLPAIIYHEKIHTRKPFQCEICCRMFSQKANLTSHKRSHSPNSTKAMKRLRVEPSHKTRENSMDVADVPKKQPIKSKRISSVTQSDEDFGSTQNERHETLEDVDYNVRKSNASDRGAGSKEYCSAIKNAELYSIQPSSFHSDKEGNEKCVEIGLISENLSVEDSLNQYPGRLDSLPQEIKCETAIDIMDTQDESDNEMISDSVAESHQGSPDSPAEVIELGSETESMDIDTIEEPCDVKQEPLPSEGTHETNSSENGDVENVSFKYVIEKSLSTMESPQNIEHLQSVSSESAVTNECSLAVDVSLPVAKHKKRKGSDHQSVNSEGSDINESYLAVGRRKKRKRSDDSGGVSYKCVVCERIFRREDFFLRHLNMHYNQRMKNLPEKKPGRARRNRSTNSIHEISDENESNLEIVENSSSGGDIFSDCDIQIIQPISPNLQPPNDVTNDDCESRAANNGVQIYSENVIESRTLVVDLESDHSRGVDTRESVNLNIVDGSDQSTNRIAQSDASAFRNETDAEHSTLKCPFCGNLFHDIINNHFFTINSKCRIQFLKLSRLAGITNRPTVPRISPEGAFSSAIDDGNMPITGVDARNETCSNLTFECIFCSIRFEKFKDLAHHYKSHVVCSLAWGKRLEEWVAVSKLSDMRNDGLIRTSNKIHDSSKIPSPLCPVRSELSVNSLYDVSPSAGSSTSTSSSTSTFRRASVIQQPRENPTAERNSTMNTEKDVRAEVFPCFICKMTFERASDLPPHVNSHFGQRPGDRQGLNRSQGKISMNSPNPPIANENAIMSDRSKSPFSTPFNPNGSQNIEGLEERIKSIYCHEANIETQENPRFSSSDASADPRHSEISHNRRGFDDNLSTAPSVCLSTNEAQTARSNPQLANTPDGSSVTQLINTTRFGYEANITMQENQRHCIPTADRLSGMSNNQRGNGYNQSKTPTYNSLAIEGQAWRSNSQVTSTSSRPSTSQQMNVTRNFYEGNNTAQGNQRLYPPSVDRCPDVPNRPRGGDNLSTAPPYHSLMDEAQREGHNLQITPTQCSPQTRNFYGANNTTQGNQRRCLPVKHSAVDKCPEVPSSQKGDNWNQSTASLHHWLMNEVQDGRSNSQIASIPCRSSGSEQTSHFYEENIVTERSQLRYALTVDHSTVGGLSGMPNNDRRYNDSLLTARPHHLYNTNGGSEESNSQFATSCRSSDSEEVARYVYEFNSSTQGKDEQLTLRTTQSIHIPTDNNLPVSDERSLLRAQLSWGPSNNSTTRCDPNVVTKTGQFTQCSNEQQHTSVDSSINRPPRVHPPRNHVTIARVGEQSTMALSAVLRNRQFMYNNSELFVNEQIFKRGAFEKHHNPGDGFARNERNYESRRQRQIPGDHVFVGENNTHSNVGRSQSSQYRSSAEGMPTHGNVSQQINFNRVQPNQRLLSSNLANYSDRSLNQGQQSHVVYKQPYSGNIHPKIVDFNTRGELMNHAEGNTDGPYQSCLLSNHSGNEARIPPHSTGNVHTPVGDIIANISREELISSNQTNHRDGAHHSFSKQRGNNVRIADRTESYEEAIQSDMAKRREMNMDVRSDLVSRQAGNYQRGGDSVHNSSELGMDVASTHPGHNRQTSFALYCKICARPFAHPSMLFRHMLTHENPTLVCDICGKPFKNNATLSRHKKIVHGIVNHGKLCGCQICSKQNNVTDSNTSPLVLKNCVAVEIDGPDSLSLLLDHLDQTYATMK